MGIPEDAPTVRRPVPLARPRLVRGQALGSYVVGAQIARGGMSIVHEVRHRNGGPTRALKVIDPQLVEDKPPEYRDMIHARARREGEVQSQWDHPHLVKVHEVLEVYGEPALVMDLVDGPTLATLIHDHATLSLEDMDALGDGLLQALVVAHQDGVIHRDIKPANVLTTRVNGRLQAQLADFGLAKTRPSVDLELTRTGQIMGTVGYMPLEQMRDAKHVSPTVDVFAAGAVLFELVTGRPLAGEAGPDAACIAEARATLHKTEGVPPRMVAAISLCLSVEPAMFVDASSVLETWRGRSTASPARSTRRINWWGIAGLVMASALASAALML